VIDVQSPKGRPPTTALSKPLFLTVAGIGLLSVGTCLGFLAAALFATGAEPPKLAKPKMAVSIPDDAAELVWQAAESLYTLGSRLREGEDPFVPMADAARALHRVADRFLVLKEAGQGDSDDAKETHEKRIPRTIANSPRSRRFSKLTR
jgi:hypothetical protein